MSDCLFCKILAGEIPADKIYEDDKMLVFKDINPKAEVHLLVIPRVHISSLNEVTDEHDDVMAHILKLFEPSLIQVKVVGRLFFICTCIYWEAVVCLVFINIF